MGNSVQHDASRCQYHLALLDKMLADGQWCASDRVRLETVMRQIAEDMAHATEADLAAEQAKSEFLSLMSHEIRTPINAILGMSHIATSSDDMAKVRECLEVIDRSALRLMNVVNDLLEVSRLDASQLTLTTEPFNFENMLMALAGEAAGKLAEKKQKFHCDIDVNMPTRFNGDEQRLSEVISKLLSNAIKFTPEGGSISISARELTHENDLSTIQISVEDNGIGISKEEQRKLFQAFYQSDSGASRHFEGVGLGLTVCKQLVAAMKGSFEVESELGKGAAFRFTAQLTRLDGGHLDKASHKTCLEGLNVLIIEPDPEVRQYFCQVMSSFKVNCLSAEDIAEGMHLIEQGRRQDEAVNILFVDWATIESDAVAMARTLKHQYSISTVAVLPLSSQNEHMITAEEDTAFRTIQKPLFPSALLRMILEIAGPPSASDVQGAQPLSFVGYHVLLVEDVEINRRIFDQIMRTTQMVVSHAENGAVAAQMFEKNPELYDIILMDINMPIMDGYEATICIRAMDMPRAKTIPIVAVTANAFPDDIERCAQVGMNGHLTKPIEIDKLFETMHSLLKADSKVTSKVPAPEQAERDENAAAAAAQWLGQSAYFDYEQALARARGNHKVMHTLLGSFYNNNHLDALRAQVRAGNYAAAMRTVKELERTTGNLSLAPLRDRLEEFGMQLQSGYQIDAAMEQLDALFVATLDDVRDALEAIKKIAKE